MHRDMKSFRILFCKVAWSFVTHPIASKRPNSSFVIVHYTHNISSIGYIVYVNYNTDLPKPTFFYLQLNTPITITDFVRPVLLPRSEVVPIGTKCFLTGFGIGLYIRFPSCNGYEFRLYKTVLRSYVHYCPFLKSLR